MPGQPLHSLDADSVVDADADAAAEDVLLGLRREVLIRSWHHLPGTGFDVVVGRGTVTLPTLDAPGVLRLAADLQRDKIVIVTGGYPMGYRTVRYHLSDGRFADRSDSRHGRLRDDCPYSVMVPGGGPSGCAGAQFAARTLKETVALAGLVRVRGRCNLCGCRRPLHVDRWRPDAAIPCPGCASGPDGGVELLCRGCQQPIHRNTQPSQGPYKSAWLHFHTASPECAEDGADRRMIPNHPRARPA